MLYFKVFKDFNNYISIDETDLERALAAFKYGTAVMFDDGAVEKVESIIPDQNRSMGWNPSHKLDDDDWNDIRSKGIDRKLRDAISEAREDIQMLEDAGRKDLIGKPGTVEERLKLLK